jgi:hypothetical protein
MRQYSGLSAYVKSFPRLADASPPSARLLNKSRLATQSGRILAGASRPHDRSPEVRGFAARVHEADAAELWRL